jgi:hypothetical protein
LKNGLDSMYGDRYVTSNTCNETGPQAVYR